MSSFIFENCFDLFAEFFVDLFDVVKPLFAQCRWRNDLAFGRISHDPGDDLIVVFSDRKSDLKTFFSVNDCLFHGLVFMPFLLQEKIGGRFINADSRRFRFFRRVYSEDASDESVDLRFCVYLGKRFFRYPAFRKARNKEFAKPSPFVTISQKIPFSRIIYKHKPVVSDERAAPWRASSSSQVVIV